MEIKLNSLPESHPLDFDWRFTPDTIEEFVELLDKEEGILAVGTPSIARRFFQLGREVLLVDRQPFQCLSNHLQIEIDWNSPEIPDFRIAVVDPPWYPEHVMTWIAWSARCVGLDGQIYASIWPPNTRPDGEDEFQGVLRWLETWSTVSLHSQPPRYELPLFETASAKTVLENDLSISPRVGRLMKINVRSLPEVPPLGSKRENWLRFVFDDYQLALRLHQNHSTGPTIFPIPGIEDCKWPYISRRAPGRDLIDIWSSRNEVAVVRNSEKVADALRQVALAKSQEAFDSALSAVPLLANWKIPRPPYRRVSEWAHPQ